MAEVDDTEEIRRDIVKSINKTPREREALEDLYGETWDPEELKRDFEVLQFSSPFIVVKRKVDGQQGSLLFQHHPRYYWGFEPASPGN